MKEDWSNSEKTALQYLGRFDAKNDTLADPAILRYMYLRSVAAKLGEKEYSKEEASAKVKNLIGKKIVTPPITFLAKGMFNCLKLNDEKDAFFSCCSNEKHTVIYSFETYYFEDNRLIDNSESFENQNFRIGAFIKEINAEGFTMPRFKITFERSFLFE